MFATGLAKGYEFGTATVAAIGDTVTVIREKPTRAEIMAAIREMQWRPKLRKAGRNDPCPCGCGKKFKRCSGYGLRK